MRNSIKWLGRGANTAPEERATLAEWQLYLGDQNVCLHLEGTEALDQVTLALYALADGLVRDWWALFGGRDKAISFLSYRMGYAVPDIRMDYDGSAVEVSAHQRTYTNPNVRFWVGPSEVLQRGDAEAVLADFVGRVLAELLKHNIRGTSLERRWSRVEGSRGDPEEAGFCEAAGALGLDPYAIDEKAASVIDDAARWFSGEPLIEFLNGLRGSLAAAPTAIAWVQSAERRPRHQSRLPELGDVARKATLRSPARSDEPAWARGYRRARAAREAMDWAPQQRMSSYKTLAKRLGASYFALASSVDGIAALRADEADGIHIHLRRQGTTSNAAAGHSFAFARAMGDALCFPEPTRFVVNELRDAYRQAAGRAFAAEFLAPVEEVAALHAKGRDVVAIADAFAVSATLIDRQLENADRIRAACT